LLLFLPFLKLFLAKRLAGLQSFIGYDYLKKAAALPAAIRPFEYLLNQRHFPN